MDSCEVIVIAVQQTFIMAANSAYCGKKLKMVRYVVRSTGLSCCIKIFIQIALHALNSAVFVVLSL